MNVPLLTESSDLPMRDDIELQFVREFAAAGLRFYPLSSEERRERIRVQIMKSGKLNQPFHDFGMAYGEAYRVAYGKPVELRRAKREATAASVPALDENNCVCGVAHSDIERALKICDTCGRDLIVKLKRRDRP